MPVHGEQNWQPQGVDTTHGAINHIYIPRSDGHVGGHPAVPQPGGVGIPIITYLGPGGPPTVPIEIKPNGDMDALVPPGSYPAAGPAPQYPVYQQPGYYPQPQPVYYPAPGPGGLLGGGGGGPGAPAQAALPAPQNYPYYHHQNVAGVNNYPNAWVQPGNYNGNHYTNHVQQPAVNVIGLTGQEVQARQVATAFGTNMNEAQEMKPADDDPQRWYWVRDLDGVYTQYNRMTIDSGDIGKVRWYVVDGGTFYAVILPH